MLGGDGVVDTFLRGVLALTGGVARTCGVMLKFGMGLALNSWEGGATPAGDAEVCFAGDSMARGLDFLTGGLISNGCENLNWGIGRALNGFGFSSSFSCSAFAGLNLFNRVGSRS